MRTPSVVAIADGARRDMYVICTVYVGDMYTAVLSKTWPAGQNWPFGVCCWALLRKNFCNGYWPFDGLLIIEMQKFTWVGWIGELYACTGTVKCHLVKYIVQCTVYSVQCTVYSVQCTVYSVQCTVYSVQCTVYSTYSKFLYLYSMYSTLLSEW